MKQYQVDEIYIEPLVKLTGRLSPIEMRKIGLSLAEVQALNEFYFEYHRLDVGQDKQA